MFKCRDCGCEFEEPSEHREYHSLDYGYETFFECPNCRSYDYTPSKECPICGNDHYGDEPFCEWCIADAEGELRTAFERYNGSTDDLIDLFQRALDNIYIAERRRNR